jgi:hypothetical protein
MKKIITVFTFLLFSIVIQAAPQMFVAGSLNGWCSSCDQLFDDGTHGDAVAFDGILSADITIAAAGRYEWKVTTADWSINYPSTGNSWVITTAPNQVVKFTFNSNLYSDSWLPTWHILNANDNPGPVVAVGDYQSWNNAGSQVMYDNGWDGDALAGDGIYCWMTTIAAPGTYYWKVVKSGSWDAWGADNRGVNSDNASYTTTYANEIVYFYLNKNTGRITSSVETALPVELTSFSASVTNDLVMLNWVTATEKNSYSFEVEKKQADINTWQKIASVKAANLSNSPRNYSYSDKNITAGKYNYRLKMVDNDGTFKYSSIVNVDITAPVKFELLQNYPNPFNPSTTIRYQLPVNGYISLKVFDMLGREVASLVNEVKLAGSYEVTLNGNQLSSGVYYYQLKSNNFVQTKKLELIK